MPEHELRVVSVAAPGSPAGQAWPSPSIAGKAGQEEEGSGGRHWIRPGPSALL